jgi:hypothetical protein
MSERYKVWKGKAEWYVNDTTSAGSFIAKCLREDRAREIAAALNAAAQQEQRPTPEKIPGTESYSYPLPDRVQAGINRAFEKHQPAAAQHAERDELEPVILWELVQAMRDFLPFVESSITRERFAFNPDWLSARIADAKDSLARFNALNAKEEHGG